VRARAALADKVRLRRLEEWKREELRRTPFALLDDPPPELCPVKRPRQSLTTKPQYFVSYEGLRTKRSRKIIPSLDAGGQHFPRRECLLRRSELRKPSIAPTIGRERMKYTDILQIFSIQTASGFCEK
jgi:hypothetical protein